MILRLFSSGVEPPVPRVEDQDVDSLPEFPTLNGVQF